MLDYYIDGLNRYAEAKTADAKTDPSTCEWLKVQSAVLKDDPASDEGIMSFVLKVAKPVTAKDAEGKERSLQDGQIVIYDVVSSILPHVYMFFLCLVYIC